MYLNIIHDHLCSFLFSLMFLFYKMLTFAKRINSTWTDSSLAILFHRILKRTTKNWDLKGTESAGM